ncbi:PD-(D/E)XK nuclease family protein [Thermosulfuriphilus sp.]
MSRIKVIPFGKDLLKNLAREVLADHPQGGLSAATVVFPSRRAGIYFRRYLWKEVRGQEERPRPLELPRIFAISDLVDELAVRLDPRSLITPVDQAWILWEICHQRAQTAFSQVAESFDRFLPWGLRLVEVFEELDQEMVEAQNIFYPPEGIPGEARGLLEHLGEIKKAYDQRLIELGVITKAGRLRLLARRIGEIAFPQGRLYLAGFFALTRAEEIIFSHWLKKGAKLYWEADPHHLHPIFERQLKVFGAEIEAPEANSTWPERISLYEAPDLHHELAVLRDLVPEEFPSPQEMVIVLGDQGALLPLLHSLSDLGSKDTDRKIPVNVTMGYPLRLTPPGVLLEMLLEVQRSRQGQRYYVPAYLRLIKHPYIKGLKTEKGPAGRIIIHLLEEKLRMRGSPYLALEEIEALVVPEALDERDWAFLAVEDLTPETAYDFVVDLHQGLIRPWESLRDPVTLAQVIRKTFSFIFVSRQEDQRPSAGNNRPQEALERVFLAGLEDELLPSLEKAFFAREPLQPITIYRLFREILNRLRTPFEGHPLEGLQVMGLLESRLLSFKRVIILDANEGHLPSVEEVNPLLPEAVRPALGLPPRGRTEIIEGYHFWRLVLSAKEVHLFYQSASSGGNLLGKRIRSRFLEQLLWEKERREKRRLLSEWLKVIPLHLEPSVLKRPEQIEKRPLHRDLLKEILAQEEISATFLSTYLTCPVRFYFRYLLGLTPSKQVTSYDAAELGIIVHRCLEEYFRSYVGRIYDPARENSPERLESLFRKEFEGSALRDRLGPERRFFVFETTLFRLKRYLSYLRRKGAFEVLDVEVKVTRKWNNWRLGGRLDRIDRRGETIVVLDYKTGGWLKPISSRALEELLGLFEVSPRASRGLDLDIFWTLRRYLSDIQLPFYVFLYDYSQGGSLINAAYIHLATGREAHFERPLFTERHFSLGLPWAFLKEVFPKILNYLIDHILEAPAFYTTDDPEDCRFCDFRPSCACLKI